MSRRNSNIRTIRKVSRGEELIAALRRGTRAERECVWPGADGFDFVLVPLLCGQLQEAYADAQKRFDILGIEVTLLTHDNFIAEVNTQVLAIAIRDPDDESRATRLFKTGAELRNLITEEERTDLTTEFIELQEAANPDLDTLTPERLDEISEAVKKKDLSTLRSFGSNTLSFYLAGMADRSSS